MDEKNELNFVYEGKPVDLKADEVRLDLITPLELTFFLVIIFAALGVILIPIWELPLWGSVISLAICLGAISCWRNTDCTYILDNKLRRLDYQRQIFSYSERYPVCRFDEIFAVAISGTYHSSKSGSWWEYTVVIICRDGKTISVSDSERDSVINSNRNGRALAEHLGVQFIETELKRTLEVKADRRTGKVTVEHKPHEFSYKLFFLIIFFIVFVSVAIALLAIFMN